MLDLREKALKLPLKPGVYTMLDKSGSVIYVGKAIRLKNRVSSYFHGEHDFKTQTMISKIADFDVIIANSEFEALVLENSLIKHHMPKYNILLRDDKGYPFIRLDIKSAYPTFSIVSKPLEDGAKYFGPYGGRNSTRIAIDSVSKALKLPTCGKKFPRDIGRFRPCLNFHMGACRAYCLKDTPREDYTNAIEEAVMIFEGKTAELANRVQERMENAAHNLQFELAAEMRDRLRAISLLDTKQRVVSSSLADTDVVGFYRGQAISCFVVLHHIGGALLDKDFELIENPMEEDGESISEILRQYYDRRCVIPKMIYLPVETPDTASLEQFFAEISGHKVTIQIPKRGDKMSLVQTANLNAKEETERVTTREEKTLKTLQWLQKALRMDSTPDRIEAFDISNTGDTDMVASMTVYVRGKPKKKDYRKFKIKTILGQDDYHSMQEVLTRRFKRYQNGDENFLHLPDLILIDGGSTHAAGAKEILEKAELNIPVFGMVKDDRHRTRALVSPGGEEISLSAQPAVFAMIGNIQEETHRFAVTYHRSLRSKNSHVSKLDSIEGVGEKRRNALLKQFGSLKAIKNAGLEDLVQVVPKNTAESIYRYFHSESGE